MSIQCCCLAFQWHDESVASLADNKYLSQAEDSERVRTARKECPLMKFKRFKTDFYLITRKLQNRHQVQLNLLNNRELSTLDLILQANKLSGVCDPRRVPQQSQILSDALLNRCCDLPKALRLDRFRVRGSDFEQSATDLLVVKMREAAVCTDRISLR